VMIVMMVMMVTALDLLMIEPGSCRVNLDRLLRRKREGGG
jgi:hypothetical protein